MIKPRIQAGAAPLIALGAFIISRSRGLSTLAI
jgi:hypothetical protein